MEGSLRKVAAEASQNTPVANGSVIGKTAADGSVKPLGVIDIYALLGNCMVVIMGSMGFGVDLGDAEGPGKRAQNGRRMR